SSAPADNLRPHKQRGRAHSQVRGFFLLDNSFRRPIHYPPSRLTLPASRADRLPAADPSGPLRARCTSRCQRTKRASTAKHLRVADTATWPALGQPRYGPGEGQADTCRRQESTGGHHALNSLIFTV